MKKLLFLFALLMPVIITIGNAADTIVYVSESKDKKIAVFSFDQSNASVWTG